MKNTQNKNVDPKSTGLIYGIVPPVIRGDKRGVIGTLLRVKTLLILTLTFLSKSTFAADEKAVNSGIPRPSASPGPDYNSGTSSADIHRYFFDTFIPYFTKGFSGLVGAVCVLFIVISGVQYLTAYTNEEQTQTAKKTLIWSCVGLVIAMISYAIVSIITNLPLPGGTS